MNHVKHSYPNMLRGKNTSFNCIHVLHPCVWMADIKIMLEYVEVGEICLPCPYPPFFHSIHFTE